MAVQSRSINPELVRYKPGLIYDADSITLVGKFSDELSAHRAKRYWNEVLSSYFLLEQERDYEMWVTSSIENSYFVLSCAFVSACGRYTFWRLINHQAPEAEDKLGGAFRNRAIRALLDSSDDSEEEKETSWVFSALNEQIHETQEAISLINRLKKLFK